MHRVMIGDVVIFKYYSSLVYYTEEMKFIARTCLFIHYDCDAYEHYLGTELFCSDAPIIG